MEKQLIISVGCEFGSGGHVIAESLAKELGIPLYDQNLLEHIAEEKNVDHAFLKFAQHAVALPQKIAYNKEQRIDVQEGIYVSG